jgi:uncharacterized protein
MVHIAFHGGEPCLAGPGRVHNWCSRAADALSDLAAPRFTIQTNGTLISDAWVDVFRRHRVHVGVSLDGPREVNDRYRLDRRGRGTYDSVRDGIERLRDRGLDFGLLSVVGLGADGLRVHRHFVALGARRINYLLPDFSHDTIAPVRRAYGPTPCADFLLPILEEWWANNPATVQIGIFRHMARLILGGRSRVDLFGNRPLPVAFVHSDGEIEGLDTLNICEPGLAKTGLNVLRDDFEQVAEVSALHRQTMFEGVPLASGCGGCAEEATCAGGHLAHRYSRARGFNNSSVWCKDLLALFRRMRELLGISNRETLLRKQILEEMAIADERYVCNPSS